MDLTNPAVARMFFTLCDERVHGWPTVNGAARSQDYFEGNGHD